MDQEDKASGQTGPVEPDTTGSETPKILAPAPHELPARVPPNLPATIPEGRPRRRLRRIVLALALLAAGAGGGLYWWQHSLSQLPAGIAWGNGRIEADEIEIDTKFAGRIAEMLADEGDMVKAGQVVARMDTRDLEASRKRLEALAQQAQRAIDEANANVAQENSQVLLARQQLERTASLVKKGFATNELLDQRQQQMDAANAALNAAQAKVIQARSALEAVTHDVELYAVNIADNTLVAPRDGRIQYRVANIGEVLPAGGKVFTMLDIAYVYMDIYLPTIEAGKTTVGSDARVVLDAYPNISIPAKVSFIATQAQFTPKTVETRSERDKLMFRVRVKIDPDLLRARADRVRSGLPGVAYVKLDPKLAWPPQLQGNVPP